MNRKNKQYIFDNGVNEQVSSPPSLSNLLTRFLVRHGGGVTKNVAILLALLCVTFSGMYLSCAAPQPKLSEEIAVMIPPTEENVKAGKALYDRTCAYCHGLNGKGDGPTATYLEPKPQNFTRGVYKFRSTHSGDLPSDWDLLKTMTVGLHGTSMLAWYNLSEKQRWQVIHYIKTFSEKFARRRKPEFVSLGLQVPFTMDSVAKGKALFLQAECYKCHGYGGKGDGPAADTLEDEWGDPIAVRDLTKGGNFARGNDPESIYLTLVTGLNGTPMPSFVESFGEELEDEDEEEPPPPEELWHLANYIHFLSREK